MPSLVEELQRDALNAAKMSDLLRKAKAIAVKLEFPELEEWVEHELNGYPGAMYRSIESSSGRSKDAIRFTGGSPSFFGSRNRAESHQTARISEWQSWKMWSPKAVMVITVPLPLRHSIYYECNWI